MSLPLVCVNAFSDLLSYLYGIGLISCSGISAFLHHSPHYIMPHAADCLFEVCKVDSDCNFYAFSSIGQTLSL